MPDSLPLYLVDDDAAILDSLSFLLTQYGYTAQTFQQGQDFLTQVNISEPGCVILDSRMPEITGQEIQQKLLECDSPLGIIFLTGHGDLPMAVSAFRKGACDFFQKPVAGQALADAIKKAHAYSRNTFEQMILQQRFETLTPREQDVMEQAIQGLTNKQISQALFVSLRTVEVHRARMMKKLGVHNLAELAKYTKLAHIES